MENKVLKKLNFKAHKNCCILNAPDRFEMHIHDLKALSNVDLEIKNDKNYDFILLFVKTAFELEKRFQSLIGHFEGDVLLWVAYIKKSSKKYQSDIHRDAPVWQVLGNEGFEGVRQVAIDEDWSALRFRHVDYIKTMKRNPKLAMSAKGKKRTT